MRRLLFCFALGECAAAASTNLSTVTCPVYADAMPQDVTMALAAREMLGDGLPWGAP